MKITDVLSSVRLPKGKIQFVSATVGLHVDLSTPQVTSSFAGASLLGISCSVGSSWPSKQKQFHWGSAAAFIGIIILPTQTSCILVSGKSLKITMRLYWFDSPQIGHLGEPLFHPNFLFVFSRGETILVESSHPKCFTHLFVSMETLRKSYE